MRHGANLHATPSILKEVQLVSYQTASESIVGRREIAPDLLRAVKLPPVTGRIDLMMPVKFPAKLPQFTARHAYIRWQDTEVEARTSW